MKRFLMVAVAGFLALAAYKPVEAATIVVDPGETEAVASGNLPNAASANTPFLTHFEFTVSVAVDTTVEIFANVIPASGSQITLGSVTLMHLLSGGGADVIAPSSGAGVQGNTFEGIYANLAAGDYTLLVDGLYKGKKASISGFITAAPIPPALLMFITALGGLGVFGYRRKSPTA